MNLAHRQNDKRSSDVREALVMSISDGGEALGLTTEPDRWARHLMHIQEELQEFPKKQRNQQMQIPLRSSAYGIKMRKKQTENPQTPGSLQAKHSEATSQYDTLQRGESDAQMQTIAHTIGVEEAATTTRHAEGAPWRGAAAASCDHIT